jgi:hypothetical protein
MRPLMIIVSFDIGEQVLLGGIPGFGASLVPFSKCCFHRRVPAISLPAHAQPTILRVRRSSATARQSYPSLVGNGVRSA